MRPAFTCACAILAGVAFAASDHEQRAHEAHEHGHGTLDIVVEGEELVVELRIPAVNVVGFEHAPRDDAEREAVRKALVPFQDAASVLAPSAAAQCEIEKADARMVSMDEEDRHEDEDHAHDESADGKHSHDEHGHDEHGHDEHGEAKQEDEAHDHDEHDEEAHEDHAAHSGAEAHSELHATYHFHCHAPQRLTRIDVRVFEHLRDAEEIDVRIVTETVQTAMELHPGEGVVELSP